MAERFSLSSGRFGVSEKSSKTLIILRTGGAVNVKNR